MLAARSLGPAPRGEYAAIMTWFGTLLMVGQLGQTAAVAYHVAREPRRAADHLATSRNIMLVTGLLAIGAGLVAAPMLGRHHGEAVWGYRLVFLTCLPTFVGASYTFALLATRLALWNLVRISQPLAYLAVLGLLYLTGGLTLTTLVWTLCLTMVAQTVLAYALCRRHGLAGGRGRADLARPLLRYGVSQVTAAVPTTLTGRLDQLVLSMAVAPAALGHYAVATSVTNLALPLVGAVGSVVYPRIASHTMSAQGALALQRRAVWTSAVLSAVLLLAVAASAPWVVPSVFGAGFRGAVLLIWLLSPGTALLACGMVCADLLRGHGRPLAVARAQGISAVAVAVLLAVLLPTMGLPGAALASTVAAGVALILMLRALPGRSAVADGGVVDSLVEPRARTETAARTSA
ncbi:oligosaccharide flippase family protein [Plantactinospora siamensis]|uniref:Oligosaccharide flippase family protein n=1 Tax=Plantactinospora siamensis TaxID=555372 RepID=A0ABV6P0N8_9ACTN